MKIREGFVSNSSTSNFLLKFANNTTEYMKTVITEEIFSRFKKYYENYKGDLEDNYYNIYCADDLIEFIKDDIYLHEVKGTFVGFKIVAYGGDAPTDEDNIWYVLSKVIPDNMIPDEGY